MPKVLDNIITAAAPAPPLGRHSDISISLSNLYLVDAERLRSVRSTSANPVNRNLWWAGRCATADCRSASIANIANTKPPLPQR
jgi:hypothetical protein